MPRRPSQLPDYGIDAPGAIRNLLMIGGLSIVASSVIRAPWISPSLFWFGLSQMIFGNLMYLYSRLGKYRHRDRILAQVDWKGDEKVLDVGTGRGLLLAGAAKHLSTGNAIGIDCWNQVDLSKNSAEAARRNLQLEKVEDRAELVSGDARELPFPDSSFDVVLSNLCLHNIKEREGRQKAIREIGRVLKPGGKAVISDMARTSEYRRAFQEIGLDARVRGPFVVDTFPPLRIVTVQKPLHP